MHVHRHTQTHTHKETNTDIYIYIQGLHRHYTCLAMKNPLINSQFMIIRASALLDTAKTDTIKAHINLFHHPPYHPTVESLLDPKSGHLVHSNSTNPRHYSHNDIIQIQTAITALHCPE